jgi:hypothetical protein
VSPRSYSSGLLTLVSRSLASCPAAVPGFAQAEHDRIQGPEGRTGPGQVPDLVVVAMRLPLTEVNRPPTDRGASRDGADWGVVTSARASLEETSTKSVSNVRSRQKEYWAV